MQSYLGRLVNPQIADALLHTGKAGPSGRAKQKGLNDAIKKATRKLGVFQNIVGSRDLKEREVLGRVCLLYTCTTIMAGANTRSARPGSFFRNATHIRSIDPLVRLHL